MPKNTKVKYQISDFFGDTNNYYIAGIQSYDTFFPFLAKLEHFFGTNVSYLDASEDALENTDYNFARAYTRLNDPCEITLFIIENKSTTFHQNNYPVLKKERNLNFHTLSLFDEYCYLLNRQGLRLYSWEHSDCDYLLLFFSSKKNNLDGFINSLKQLPQTRIFTTSNWFEEEDAVQPKTKEYKEKKQRQSFFENFFCSCEIAMIEREQRNIKRCMANVTSIPAANLIRSPFELMFDFDNIPEFTSQYVEFLAKDPSFEE